VRLAIYDDRDNVLRASECLEAADFFIDIFALRGIRRAYDNQKLRGFERNYRLVGQRWACGKVFAVAEYRTQGLGYRPGRCFPANQLLIDGVAFKRCMQPLSPRRIAVAVAQEGPIFESGYSRQSLSPRRHRLSQTVSLIQPEKPTSQSHKFLRLSDAPRRDLLCERLRDFSLQPYQNVSRETFLELF
jgi:hypothetical protein